MFNRRGNLNKGLIPQGPVSGLKFSKDNYKQIVNPHEARMNFVLRVLTLCNFTATRCTVILRVCIRLDFHLKVSGMHLKCRLAWKESCVQAQFPTSTAKFICPREEYTEIHIIHLKGSLSKFILKLPARSSKYVHAA